MVPSSAAADDGATLPYRFHCVSKPLAFCITTLRPGGAERQLTELVLRLPSEGFKPHVIALAERPPPSECELIHRLTARNAAVTFLNARHRWDFAITLLRLRRHLQRIRPVLVQSFLAHANIASAVAARMASVPIVVTGIRVAERRSNLHAWLARRTERWVARHVCVSHSVAEFAIRDMLLDPRKVTAIPNGVDVEAFATAVPLSREELGLPPDARVLLHVGRLDPQKRIEWLLARFAEALPQIPDTHLLLVGTGPLQGNLAENSSQLGIADRVRFLGWRNDVPRLLATCDALVQTSAWEGMPNVVLEAMSAARPVLVTEVEGAREVLGPLAEEQLVAHYDDVAFVERLIALSSDRDQAIQIGGSNQERVREKFSLDETVWRYAELYRELLR